MSWLSSVFSNIKFPPPADAVRSHEKRVLEEPLSTSKSTTDLLPTSVQPSQAQTQTQSEPLVARNKIIFGAGVGFFALSLLVTRRAYFRRRIASNPAFYTNGPSHHAEQSAQTNGAMEAFEALNIATINVLSVAMMGTGAALWYWDVNSMDDARRLVRRNIGVVDANGNAIRTDQDAEEEMEEWMATVLARKEMKQDQQRRPQKE